MRFAHFLRGFKPLPRSDRKIYPMRLLGDDLNLIEFKLNGGLAAEHGNNHIDRILVDLNALNSAGEGAQGTIEDPDSIAHIVVDDDFLLLNAHGVNFIFCQRNRIIAGRAHEACDTADRFDDMPGVIAVDHFYQNIAGEHLAVVSLADAGLGDFGDGFQRNGNCQNLIVQTTAFNGLFNGGLYSILIAGVGMDNIPSCSICLGSLPFNERRRSEQ